MFALKWNLNNYNSNCKLSYCLVRQPTYLEGLGHPHIFSKNLGKYLALSQEAEGFKW